MFFDIALTFGNTEAFDDLATHGAMAPTKAHPMNFNLRQHVE
eukprot:CAMPEP_0178381370 /NCGR_PEP_ID=MMETSP0689_2-20121128/5946_1 /TAXON_ID=160604 /ORGANISM="Amphidinium massartii, Strain CS-259" /LENGTH=41 /DNA_ID= /DNA_START= /DNA_END= /DNA_ORIENTATION=